MSWHASSLAFALRAEDAANVSDAAALQGAWTQDTPFVHAMSRNGVLLTTVCAINEQFAPGSDFYLGRKLARLQGVDLARALAHIEALLACIETNPAVVLEATKTPYTPHVFLHSKEFAPLPAEMVYPGDAVIRDGYVFEYTEDEVRQMLRAATASENPQPSNDDDGESLEYVFNFLKSHQCLLKRAIEADLTVICGELG